MKHNVQMREKIERILLDSLIMPDEYQLVFISDNECILLFSACLMNWVIEQANKNLCSNGFNVSDNEDLSVNLKENK